MKVKNTSVNNNNKNDNTNNTIGIGYGNVAYNEGKSYGGGYRSRRNYRGGYSSHKHDSYNSYNSCISRNSYILHREYNKGNNDNASHDNNYILEQIIDAFACPAKSVYNPRDIVFVQINNQIPIIATVKFVINDGYIVRPFGASEMKEIKITKSQIVAKTHGQISRYEIKRIMDSIQCETYAHFHGTVNELYYDTLIKYDNDVFGNIICKNDNDTYDIKIKQECKWYNGPQIITQIARSSIVVADEYEFKYFVAKFENNTHKLSVKTFDSDDTNKMDVYYFLDETGNYYIHEFIKNGFTSISFLLLITKQDLIAMGVTLAHRRYILHKIQSYHKDEFDIISQQKQKMVQKNDEIQSPTNNDNSNDNNDAKIQLEPMQEIQKKIVNNRAVKHDELLANDAGKTHNKLTLSINEKVSVLSALEGIGINKHMANKVVERVADIKQVLIKARTNKLGKLHSGRPPIEKVSEAELDELLVNDSARKSYVHRLLQRYKIDYSTFREAIISLGVEKQWLWTSNGPSLCHAIINNILQSDDV